MTASLLQQSFEPSTRLFNLTTGPEAVEYGTMLITHSRCSYAVLLHGRQWKARQLCPLVVAFLCTSWISRHTLSWALSIFSTLFSSGPKKRVQHHPPLICFNKMWPVNDDFRILMPCPRAMVLLFLVSAQLVGAMACKEDTCHRFFFGLCHIEFGMP